MMLDLSAICWDRPSVTLGRRQELTRTQGGVSLKKDMGPALWRVSLTSFPLSISDADALYAQLEAAEYETILVKASYATFQPAHRSALSGVSVAGVSGDRLTLSGVPADVVLPIGARMSVVVAQGREFFQLLDASDSAGGFRVTPEIRGVQAAQVVELSPPCIEVMVDPGSVEAQHQTRLRKRVSFSGTQVIR